MNEVAGARAYLLGHTDEELARLERQAAMFAEPTAEVLRRAGLAPGMSVLDVGCGVGDVTLAAAAIVGPSGTVLGVDRSAQALATARGRAASAGVGHAAFAEADLDGYDPGRSFDAVIGRFILMHLADPAATISRMLRHVRPGGIVAFIEMDTGSALTEPRFESFEHYLGLISQLYEKAGIETRMGSKLYGAFRAAGLAAELLGSCRVEAGHDTVAYDYLADSLRSLLPSLEHFGIARAADVGIDGIAARMRAEGIAGGYCFVFPRVIGAWAVRPG